jgi:pimeloyl-ACP methyl ester carboxylesterase
MMIKKLVTLSNSETLAYLEKGAGDNVLILIHGNLSSSVYYQPLIDRLPSSLRVLAPDLRGFGDSTYHKRVASLSELADDVILLMDALNIKKASICGWSLGGGVAMELSALYPKRVKKLILIDSTTHKGYPIFKKDAAFKPVLGSAYLSPDEMAADPLQVKHVIDAINQKNAAFMTYIYDLTIYTHNKPSLEANQLYIAETLKQRNLADVDFALASLNLGEGFNSYTQGNNRIKNITAPVLHIWGTLDKVVPEYMVLENIEALKEQSIYIKFEDCGHSPLVDKPDELGIAITEFVV